MNIPTDLESYERFTYFETCLRKALTFLLGFSNIISDDDILQVSNMEVHKLCETSDCVTKAQRFVGNVGAVLGMIN